MPHEFAISGRRRPGSGLTYVNAVT
jgi:hypothetical protein